MNGIRAMNTSILTLPRLTSDFRRQAIQDSWSDGERRARAAAGQRHREQLADLLLDPADQEIWAVGAPCSDDLSRLAG